MVMSACSHPTHGFATAEPGKPLDADSLIVSLDDLRQITGSPGLVQLGELSAKPPGGGGAGNRPAPCRAVSDMSVAFGQTWTQFKGFYYGTLGQGPEAGVLQAVGVYSDDTAARTAFEQLLVNLQQCSDMHWGPYEDLSVQQQDPSNFVLRLGKHYSLYRVKDAVVIEVDAYGLTDSAQVANTVMQTISGGIPDA
jgi:hypothetical protein